MHTTIRDIELMWQQPWMQWFAEVFEQVFRDHIKVVRIGEYTHRIILDPSMDEDTIRMVDAPKD